MEKTGLLMTNPIVRKVANCEETGAQEHVTYGGIAAKMILFLLFTAIGAGLFYVLKDVGAALNVKNFTVNKTTVVAIESVRLGGMIGLIAAVLCFIISPIVTALTKRAVPFNGMLYCASTGYMVTFVAHTTEAYRLPILMAFCLTIALFIALALIYSTGKIKVSAKFKTAFFGIVLASLVFSLMLAVFSFIPALKFIPAFFRGNTVFAVIASVLGLIIAVIFVIVDFSVVQDAVDRELPKHYEWFCAYALVFSLIYLYFKVLDILLRVMGRSKSK